MLLEALIPSTLYTVYKSGLIGINWYKLYTGKPLPCGDVLIQLKGYKELVCLDETRQIQRTPFMLNTGGVILPLGQGVQDTEQTVFTKLLYKNNMLDIENCEPRGFSAHPEILKEKSYINTSADFQRFCEQYKVNPERVPIRLPLIKEVYKIPETLPIYSSKQTVWVGPNKKLITTHMSLTHSFKNVRSFGIFLASSLFTVCYGGLKLADWKTHTKWELKYNYPSLSSWLK
jgi:hypothetical protein